MNKKLPSYLLISAALILLGLSTLSAYWEDKNAPLEQQHMSEKINLALRKTAHQLLKQAGDSISTLAPVQKKTENAYLVRIEQHFNYDSLIILLKNNFYNYNITAHYDVVVLNCQNEKELLWGYSSLDFLKDKDMACIGRSQAQGCYNFKITFTEISLKMTNIKSIWFFLGGLGILSMVMYVLVPYFSPKKTEATPPSVFNAKIHDMHLIAIGNSLFDTHLQIVSTGENQQKMTFRESKLLELFCHHKNEVLDRDFILKEIWDDDGALVSRSVDVFVSRLRKILKNDDSLKIKNIHNRGYRLEISISPQSDAPFSEWHQ
jgi:DNA-binding winged helix-turn-helix (wHTH) protein